MHSDLCLTNEMINKEVYDPNYTPCQLLENAEILFSFLFQMY
jgi:hypothetical protein